jgi:CheY-like chemotaxis protein/signal transduction histidine kinase
VSSEPGVGSEFTVELPLGCAHLPPGQVSLDQAGDPSGRRVASFVEEALRWLPSGEQRSDEDGDVVHDMTASDASVPALVSPHRIVLADDNNDLRDYIAGLLRSRGHLVETVVDGAEALEVIRRLKPDLLVTDVMMPRMDGMALLRVIRSDASLQDLPVIVLSARAGEEARVAGLDAGADDYLAKPFSARELIARVDSNLALTRLRRHVTTALREETRMLEALNRTGASLAGQLDLERVVQLVTDAGVELTGAQFGAFFYNVTNATGEAYMLYTLSGVDRSAFDRFPMPRNTRVFAPTFDGSAIVRSDDITKDPRYGHNSPYHGMPEGHLPVRSYLAVPVRSRGGDVLGGLFFGHAEPGRFSDRHERLMTGVAGQAAVALDNSRLYRAAHREIEQRKAAERALQVLNERLEDRVAEEIQVRRQAETALQQAQKMEAIGQLTGGVAHDFNNLLQVISGNLQLLSRDLLGNERAEARLQNALEGVARGTRLASQLLAYGRRQPLEPKVINAGRFVRGLDDLLRRALGEEIEIETTVAAGLWNTFADPSQIENALLNLAINARDAMNGRGKLTIEVGNALISEEYAATHADVVPGQYVMLAVTDTGCGIAPEILDRVFEPFFTTKSEGRGTGLGLSMVYGFVKQSGGHVKIYSEVGLGTTIKLYLPRSIANEEMPADSSPLASVGGSEIVLVVEDDAQVRATAVDLLSDLGYRVLQATDATGALAVVESGVPIDLLFTDVVMPGPLRSPELARRARERLPGIAVLFTSGYAEDAIVHDGRLDEGVSLLAKPYTREALSRKIRQVLVNQQQANVERGLQPRSEVPMMPAPVSPPVQDNDLMRVLLVEDEEILRLVTIELLEEMGHVVHSAQSAEEALTLLGRHEIDVLITDVSLPGRTGFELATEAGALQPGIGIVFASGGARLPPEWRSATLLLKPYKVKALEECLRKLGKRGGRKE